MAPKLFDVKTIEIKTKGRKATTVTVQVLGEVDAQGHVATDMFRGAPLLECATACQRDAVDPSEAMIRGRNDIMMERARSLAPSAAKDLVARGFATDPKQARLGAMHIGKLSRLTGVPVERLTDAVVKAREDHSS